MLKLGKEESTELVTGPTGSALIEEAKALKNDSRCDIFEWLEEVNVQRRKLNTGRAA